MSVRTDKQFANESQLSFLEACAVVREHIGKTSARCPACKHVGCVHVETGGTKQAADATIRKRICYQCGFRWETITKIERACNCCGSTNLRVKRTDNSNQGIHRTHQCQDCGHKMYTTEPFIVPEHLLAERRRRLSQDFFG